MCLHFRSTSFDTCGLVNFFCFLVVFVFVFVVVDVVVVVVVFLGGHAILFACLSVDGHLCIYLVSPLFACFFFFFKHVVFNNMCVYYS